MKNSTVAKLSKNEHFSLDKYVGNRYTKKAVHCWVFRDYNDEIRSRAMGIYEPCQVGNKAALSRTSHVP